MSALPGAVATRLPARPWWPWLALLLGLLLLFQGTANSMLSLWLRSDTFAHALLVPVISAWLAWRQRERLVGLPVAPVFWLLLPMSLLCLLWLVGHLGGVQAAQHFALVALVVLSVPAVLGWAVARELAFPTLFLFFAVPFGEFLTPWLMGLTADFTVQALRLTGVPVYRDGLQFVIPSGNWSVVDACSGLRYLMASFMVGTLFAYLNFRTPRRRLAFMGVSLVVPVVANLVRAYLIVMIGHLSSNRLATGVDHLVYGWLFFGLVVGLMFVIGARWARSEPAAPAVGLAGERLRQPAAAAPSPGAAWGMVLAVLALGLAAQWQQVRSDRALSSRVPVLSLPAALPGGWQLQAAGPDAWAPAFVRPRAVAAASYARAGRAVGVWLGYYRSQNDQVKLVSSVNQLVTEKDPHWVPLATGPRSPPPGDLPTPWRTAVLRGTNPLAASDERRLEVWQVYWVGGRWVSSDALAKVWLAWDRLLGQGDDGAVLMLHAPATSPRDPALADLARVLPLSLAGMLEGARAAR